MNWLLLIRDELVMIPSHVGAWIINNLPDVFGGILVGFIGRHIILGMVSDWLTALIKRMLVQTLPELVVWNHYFERTLKRGHQTKTTRECTDGLCAHTVK